MSGKFFKSTAIVGSMTFISRILGFIRDVVIARLFGAGLGADVFFVAFKIPNFLRRLFAEGAFSQAFIPVLSDYKLREGDDLKVLVNAVSGSLGGVLFIITAIGVLAAPWMIMAFAPGFINDAPKITLAGEMLRITFPYLFFISLTALSGAILNSFGRFAVPAFTPVFLNLSLIGCAIWLSPMMDEPVKALAWGVFIGGAVQLLFQIPFLLKINQLPKPHWGWQHEGVKKIRTLMLPAMFGVSVSQINLLFDTLLASFLVTGSISWLYFSDRIVEFPLGVFGVALATVILPGLSQQHAKSSPREFSRTLDWALRWALIIGTPAVVGIVVLAEPLLISLFQYGEFMPSDANRASHSLLAYSVGLLAFILIKVLAPAFFARQDTKTPVKIGIIAMVVNMVLNLVLMIPLAHVGLALATSLSAILNASLLYLGLRREGVYQPAAGWVSLLAKIALANAVMLAVLVLLNPALETWLDWDVWHRFAALLPLIAVAMVVYFVILGLSGVPLKRLLKPNIS